MRVVLATKYLPDYPTGVGEYIGNLADNLMKLGHKVVILTSDLARADDGLRFKNGKDSRPPWMGNLSPDRSPVVYRGIRVMGIPTETNLFIERPSTLVRSAKELSPDIVHVQDLTLAFSFAMLCYFPLVFTVQTLSGDRFPQSGLLRGINHLVNYFALRLVPNVICLTQYQVGEVERLYGISHRKIRRIPSGIDPGRFSPVNAKRFIQTHMLQDCRIVLYVGRLAPNKNLDMLLRAFARTAAKHEDLRLVLVGRSEGAARKNLESLGSQLGMRRKLIFIETASNEDVLEAYSASSVVTLPSNFEQFGKPVLEAMAVGRPVVASDLGVAHELIYEGLNGYLFQPGNACMLSEKLELALQNYGRWSDLRDFNLPLLDDYRWPIITRQIAEFYLEASSSR